MTSWPRGKYQGVLQIIRFNWPQYLSAAAFLGLGCLLLRTFPMAFWLRALIMAALAAGAFWLVASLVVSHYVYDRSEIYRVSSVLMLLPETPRRWANFHCGLDEFTALLLAAFPGSNGTTVDIFDAREMTEPSIRRARECAQTSSIKADFRHLPFEDSELDAAFVFFAAHELRRADARRAFFSELRRVLSSRGCVILLEHLREEPNLLAFGPGAFHFHSRRTWLET
ncbi:MAG: hypothetical protein DLM52_09565, partial [Chthoniobacterales bacterium]